MAFFKRAQYDSPASKNGQVTTVAALPQALEGSELRRVVNPLTLGFKTTDELDPASGLIRYQTTQKIREKNCTVTITAIASGKKVSTRWSFNVEAQPN